MRPNRRILKWIALGLLFVLPHLAWLLYFIGDSIGDSYRMAELRGTRLYGAQLRAIYPLVAKGNPSREALVQAMTLNGTVQVYNESSTFAQAGTMTLLFSPDGKFVGIQGLEGAEQTPPNFDPAAAAAVPPQSLSFAIYSLPVLFGNGELIAEGTRTYSPADIRIDPGVPPVVKSWGKTLEVSHGFSIDASVYRQPKIEGFGLSLSKDGQGESWEWFDLEGTNIFVKRQGDGKVKVRMRRVDGEEELAAIEFLDDVTLRLRMDAWWQALPFMDHDTHHLVVKKGSVLWLAP